MAEAPRYDDSLTIVLLQARDAVTAQFRDHVGEAGLTLQQWRVIRALAGGTELDTTTLASRCVILAPSLTRIIRHLAERDLIVNVPTRDRRQRVIRLTAEGEALFTPSGRCPSKIRGHRGRLRSRREMRHLVVSLNRLRACLETDGAPG